MGMAQVFEVTLTGIGVAVLVVHERDQRGVPWCGAPLRGLPTVQPARRVLCMACEQVQGRRPGMSVRAPRATPPELRREVAALMGSVRHFVVEWLSPSGAIVRSATACGMSTSRHGAELLTGPEWQLLRGRSAPDVGSRSPCRACASTPPGVRAARGDEAAPGTASRRSTTA